MEQWASWIRDNWFSFVQSVGIVGGLLFTAWSLKRDSAERKTTARLALAEHHRELWAEVHRRPDLARILCDDVELLGQPVTAAEDEFLNVVIYHFQTCWELGKNSSLLSMKVLALDARDFFSHPIPAYVWRHSRSRRDPKFVAFIESCLAKD